MHYLAALLERYGGRVAPARAAYNAGPHRLSFWSTFPEYQDEELFAERIPFAETGNYVKIVQQNASLYARLYTDETTLSPIGNRAASDREQRSGKGPDDRTERRTTKRTPTESLPPRRNG